MIIGKIVLLYDSDTGKPEETYDSLAIRKMETVQNNDLYEIGIESLLTLYPEFNKDSYYQERIKKDKYDYKLAHLEIHQLQHLHLGYTIPKDQIYLHQFHHLMTI